VVVRIDAVMLSLHANAGQAAHIAIFSRPDYGRGEMCMNVNEKKSIQAVRKDAQGRNIAFRLSSREEIDYHEAIDLALNGQIENVNAFRGKDGDYHLRSNADGNPNNNLDNLPTF
jgi:Protein of unknown function (DUF3892)